MDGGGTPLYCPGLQAPEGTGRPTNEPGPRHRRIKLPKIVIPVYKATIPFRVAACLGIG